MGLIRFYDHHRPTPTLERVGMEEIQVPVGRRPSPEVSSLGPQRMCKGSELEVTGTGKYKCTGIRTSIGI